MDRFVWATVALSPNETKVFELTGVRLYDGDSKTHYEGGSALLTTHRLVWYDKHSCMALSHVLVVGCDVEAAGFMSSSKVP